MVGGAENKLIQICVWKAVTVLLKYNVSTLAGPNT